MKKYRLFFLILSMFYYFTGYCQDTIVSVNGLKYHVKCIGKGDMTVIFECGMGMDLTTWRGIEDSVAIFSKVFMYDRLGLGQSDTTSRDRTIPNMVSELRALLNHENIKPPYILVPHSMGSYIARYYMNLYPEEVKGILFLDPSAETYYDNLTPEEQIRDQEIGNNYYKTQSIGSQNERKFYLSNRRYMSELQIPNNIPVVLVSTNSWNLTPSQSKIIEEHPKAKHVILEGRHDVYNVYPERIIGLIKDLVKQTDF